MISPKEKADELVKKMYNTEHCGIEHFPNKRYCDCTGMNLYQAKQCALIAVDEIIEANPYKWVPFMDQYTETVLTSNIPYWQEVKQEIELIRVGK
jgi:hypothetical protein